MTFVVVDALNVDAAGFYEAHGFIQAADSQRLFLPMATVAKLFDTD